MFAQEKPPVLPSTGPTPQKRGPSESWPLADAAVGFCLVNLHRRLDQPTLLSSYRQNFDRDETASRIEYHIGHASLSERVGRSSSAAVR
jgi:hypothetical protein